MKLKSLSILAIGGMFAGTAFAGPGDAYLVFPKASAEKETGNATIARARK